MAPILQLLIGIDTAANLDELATLRIGIFQEFSYLYDGRREDELTYLKTYAETPDAFVIIAKDGEKVVGAATGMPLRHEAADLVESFSRSPYAVDQVYYVGELLFHPEYRNRGLGMQVMHRGADHLLFPGAYAVPRLRHGGTPR